MEIEQEKHDNQDSNQIFLNDNSGNTYCELRTGAKSALYDSLILCSMTFYVYRLALSMFTVVDGLGLHNDRNGL